MKHYKIISGILSFILLSVAITASAAGVSLTNGGLGQQSGDVGSFGFAACNSGTAPFSGIVPIAVAANGISETVNETISVAVASCAYSYVPYTAFNMVPGNTYLVTVTIDPQLTVISNSDNQGSYTVTVPSVSGIVPGLPNTGVSPAQEAAAIGVNLSRGDYNNNVAILQQFLIFQNTGAAAQALAQAGATGYFGVLTQAALAEFQASVGITPPAGFFGPITRAYLTAHF